jgi:RimJ/RimL family protein N-acetyltransferase
MLETPRLRLRTWRAGDKPFFAAMCADPEVMRDLGGPITRDASEAKLERYAKAYAQRGLSRWVVETHDGVFLGYTGVLHRPEHPLGEHYDLGWRLVRSAWGLGYATEAARAALDDAFTRANLTEILAYTSPDNPRSHAVMARLNLRRAPARDFTADFGQGDWHGLMWIADRASWPRS